MTEGRAVARDLVRLQLIAGGHVLRDYTDAIDDITIIRVPADRPCPDDAKRLPPETRRIIDLCQHGGLSVAEIAAHLRLPLTLVKALLSKLLAQGRITGNRQITPDRDAVTPALLERVLIGLRRI